MNIKMTITSLLDHLREKYGKPEKLTDLLKEKYSESNDFAGDISQEVTKENILCFTESSQENYKKLEKILSDFEGIKEDVVYIYEQAGNGNAGNVLVNQFDKKINDLMTKDLNNPEKLAENLRKILETTIRKLWSEKEVEKILRAFLTRNGIRLIDYEPGHKLKDKELVYVDGSSFEFHKEETQDEKKDREVIKMIRPAMVIAYEEEDEEEVQYKILEGMCQVYIYKEELKDE